MSADLAAALGRARAASAFYAVAWGVFVVVCVAGFVAAIWFPKVLQTTEQAASALLLLILFVGCALPAVADAVLAWVLTGVPAAAGQPRVETGLRLLLVGAALTLPLVAITASVSSARKALPETERAVRLPDAGWTLLVPLVLCPALGMTGAFLAVVWPYFSSSTLVPTLVSYTAFPVLGLLRIVLGLVLRSVFAERLRRISTPGA